MIRLHFASRKRTAISTPSSRAAGEQFSGNLHLQSADGQSGSSGKEGGEGTQLFGCYARLGNSARAEVGPNR